MGMFGYWPDPDKDKTPGGPNRKPKDPVAGKPVSFVKLLFFLCLASYALYIMLRSLNPSDNTNGPAAVSGPVTEVPRKPATIMDDDAGVLIVYPSVSWARDDQLINEMAFAKSEWQKQNPHKHVVACDHLRDRPTDYGYCWIIHYEKR